MSKDNEIILDQDLESAQDDFEFDAAINELAMNALNYMNDQVSANANIPEDNQFEVLDYAIKAMLFNAVMLKADRYGIDPKESVEQLHEELMQAVESMHGHAGCCDHHH